MQEINERWLDQLGNIEREISSAHESLEETEKKARLLIKKIVTVLWSVYRACLDLSRRFIDM